MDKRTYNILFHTHTVSGIIISVALYVIFFAGSFAFFRDEIVAWERNEPVEKATFQEMDLNRMLDSLGQRFELYSRDVYFNQYYQERRIGVSLSAPKDTTLQAGREFFYMNSRNMETHSYSENYSIGEFLYRLHFFAQLNFFGSSGYALAGLVAFFFLFAIVTGFLVHWKKIVSNFYLFRPWAKWKTVWTDSHTALGIIGLPYQFMFAVTGAFLIFGTIAMGPPVAAVIYDGNTQKMYKDLGPETFEYPLAMQQAGFEVDLKRFVDRTKAHWEDFRIKSVEIINYKDANMHVIVNGHPFYSKSLTGEGMLAFNAASGKIVSEKNPFDATYYDTAIGIIDRLHYGDFGGIVLRIIYFILGLLSCFVIISGILIWLVARDKKHIEEKKRKFNSWMGHVFLSTCLGIYPATAFTFVAVKFFVHEFDPSRMTSIYHIFFYSWLVLIVLFTLKRDNYFTNKACLVLGAILGFMVPVANGMVSGNWPWKTWEKEYFDIFFVDAFWVVLSAISLIVALSLKQRADKATGKRKKSPQEKTRIEEAVV